MKKDERIEICGKWMESACFSLLSIYGISRVYLSTQGFLCCFLVVGVVVVLVPGISAMIHIAVALKSGWLRRALHVRAHTYNGAHSHSNVQHSTTLSVYAVYTVEKHIENEKLFQ